MSIGAEFEQLLYKRVFVTKALNIEKYEEAVIKALQTPTDSLVNVIRDSVDNNKVFVALAISEAILRKPLLGYRLQFMFKQKGDSVIEVFDTDNAVFRYAEKPSDIDEKLFENFIECSRYSKSVTRDVRKCREEFISSLIKVSKESSELASAIFPLAAIPSSIDMKTESLKKIQKYAILWPYIVKYSGNGEHTISWYNLENFKQEIPIKLEKVNYATGVSLNDFALFTFNTSSKSEYASFVNSSGKMETVGGLKVCCGNEGYVYVLESRSEKASVSVYDGRGVIYRRTLGVPSHDVELVSCTPLLTSGVVFKIEKPKNSTLVVAKRGTILEHTLDYRIEHLVATPLDILLGFARTRVVVFWVTSKGLVNKEIDTQIPHIARVYAIPYFGILLTTEDDVYQTNYVNTAKRSIKALFNKVPSSITASWFPTFSLIIAKDNRGFVDKLLLADEKGVSSIELNSIELLPVKDLAYSSNTICLITEDGSLNCFSPMYLKNITLIQKPTSLNILGTGKLLEIYREGGDKDVVKLMQIVNAVHNALNIKTHDSYLIREGELVASAEDPVNKLSNSIDRLLLKSVRRNVTLDWLELVIHEYFSKSLEDLKTAKVLVKYVVEKYGITEPYIDKEILAILSHAYRIMSNANDLVKLEPRQLLSYLSKVFGCLEAIGVKEVSPSILQHLLPGEAIKVIIPKLVNYVEQCNDHKRFISLSYLASLGIQLEAVKSKINNVFDALSRLGLEQLTSLLKKRIREVLTDGDLRKLENLVDSMTDILSEVNRSSTYIPQALYSLYIDEIAKLLGEYLTTQSSTSNYLNAVCSIVECYKELASTYNRVNSLITAIGQPLNIDVHKSLLEYQSCRDKVRKLNYLEKQLNQLLNSKNEAEKILAEIRSLSIRPKVIDNLFDNIKLCISNLDTTSLGKELISLRSCLEVTRSFNSGISKLVHLAKILSSSKLIDYVDSLIQEFKSLDRVDKNIIRKSQDLVGLDVDVVVSYLNSVETKLKCLDVDVVGLRNDVNEGFVQKISEDNYGRAVVYLQQVNMLLEQLCLEMTKYREAVMHLLSKLKNIGISESLLNDLSQRERTVLTQHLAIDSVSSLQARFDYYKNIIITRKNLVDDLRSSVERLYKLYQELEVETRKAIQRILLSKFEDIIKAYDIMSLNSLRDLLEYYVKIVSDADFLDLNKQMNELDAQKQTLTSATAKGLLDLALNICREKLIRREFKEVRDILVFTYRELICTMKYENIDKLVSTLEEVGLNVMKYVTISIDTFQRDVIELIGKLKKLNEIYDFLNICPAAIARMIDMNRNIDDTFVASLKLLKELRGGVKGVCSTLEAAAFSSIDEAIVNNLAAIGKDLVGYTTQSRSEELLLAYVTFLKYFGELAANEKTCQDLPLLSGKVLIKVYDEFCGRGDVGKSLMYASLACIKKYDEEYECRNSVELLGGFYINKYIKLVNDLASLLGVRVDDASIYRFILDGITSSITSIDNGDLRNISSILSEMVSRFEKLVVDVSNYNLSASLSTAIKNKDKVDLAEMVLISSLYVNLIKNAQLDKGVVDVKVFGELVDGDTSSLVLEICNRLPIPLVVREPLLDFVDMNFKVFMNSVGIEPRRCSSTSTSIRRMYDVDKLHLGREARANVEFKCILPGTSKPLTYSIPIHVPVRYYGESGELIEVINSIIKDPGFRKKVTIDVDRLREIIRGVGGNNVVILGRYIDGSEVVVKIPVFYKDISSMTLYRELIENCTRLAEQCVNTTHKCSQISPSVVEVLEIGLNPPYAVERFTSGKLLRDLISVRGKLSLDEALNVAISVSEGVLCIHSRDIYHNDIRPENVIVQLDNKGRISKVFLIDICIDSVWNSLKSSLGGRSLRTSKSRKNIDERYLHPNLIKMLETTSEEHMINVRKAVDVFQIGVLIYEMLTGINPVAELGDLRQTRKVLQYIPTALPTALKDALEKALFPSSEYIDLKSFNEILKKVKGS
ncbi:MAG: protein kinase [Thermofilaceae archaeon]|nr:protein kinase [Thermofilaceae archaeon]